LYRGKHKRADYFEVNLVYLIGLLALLMIVAPIVAILPSSEQKAQMVKRKLAMADNLRVELTHIDDPDPNPEKYLSNTGMPLERRLAVKAYRLALRRPAEWREKPLNHWSFVRRLSHSSLSRTDPVNGFLIPGWESEDVPEEGFSEEWRSFFEVRIPRLADDIVRIEEINFIVSIYWQEQGDVKELLEFLSAYRNFRTEN